MRHLKDDSARPRARHRAHPEASSGGSRRPSCPACRARSGGPGPGERRALQSAGSRFPIACGESERRSSRPRALRAPRPRRRGAPGRPCPGARPSSWSSSAAARSWWWRSFWPSPERSRAGAMTARHRRPPARPPTSASSGPQGFPVTDIKVPSSGRYHNSLLDPEGVPDAPAPDAGRLPDTGREEGGRQGDQAGRRAADSRSFRWRAGRRSPASSTRQTLARRVIPIPLTASKGVPGSGAAALGVTNANQPFFDVRLTGVKPAPKGSAYIVWFVLA